MPGAAELFEGVANCPRYLQEYGKTDGSAAMQLVLDKVREGTLRVAGSGDVLQVGVLEGRTIPALLNAFPDATLHCFDDAWKDATGTYGRFLANVCDVPESRLVVHVGRTLEALVPVPAAPTTIKFA